MKLYHIPYTSAFRPRWLLEEVGLVHEVVPMTLSPTDTKNPTYLKVHPLGQVPALVDGDLALIESAAICMYLAERDPNRALVPAEGTPERARYYQWIFYAMDSLSPVVHPLYLRWFMAPPEQKSQVATEAELAVFRRVVGVVETALSAGPFLLGERFTTADVIMGGVLQWAEAAGLLTGSTEARAYHERLRARPAYQRALV